MRVLRTLLTAAGVIVLDVGFVIAGSLTLWWNGGSTVANGPMTGFVVFVVVGSILVIMRNVCAGYSSFAAPTDLAAEKVVSLAELGLLATSIVIWQMTGQYLFGWIACFATFSLLTLMVLQLLVDVLSARNKAGHRDEVTRRRGAWLLDLETLRLFTTAGAVFAFVFVSPIHGWSAPLVNPIFTVIVAPIGIALLASLVIQRVRSVAPHSSGATPAVERNQRAEEATPQP